MATNHDDQLGEIYQTMLNELNSTFDVSFSRFHSCGRHGHGLWPSWYRPNLATLSSTRLVSLSHVHSTVVSDRVECFTRHIIGYFGDKSLQAISCTGTDKQKKTATCSSQTRKCAVHVYSPGGAAATAAAMRQFTD